MAKVSKVFHPSDFSAGDAGAFMHALRIALSAKGKLTILHTGAKDEEFHWTNFPQVRGVLKQWKLIPEVASRDYLKELGLSVNKISKAGNDPVKVITGHIDAHLPDLVVLATHQRQGLDRLLHRAIAEPIARQAGVMTLFVPRRAVGFVSRESGTVRLRQILVPIDHQPHPQMAVDAALRLARTLGAEDVHLNLLYVGPEEDMPEVRVDLPDGWTMEKDAWQGGVVDHILDVSEDRNSDLIVMATDGRKGFLDAWRGTTTERVLRQAQCPVLAVPA